MRVLIVGAGGVGSAAALILARRGFVDRCVVADYDVGRARATVDRVGDAAFVPAELDASDPHAVAELCRTHGVTHVLNAVDPRFVLSVFGFVANQDQSDTAMLGIRLMFSIFPAVLAMLSALAIFFYGLSSDKVRQIEKELAERR